MSITSNYVKFLWGTPQSYKNLRIKQADTLYFIAEADSATGELYWGERLIASAIKNIEDLENIILENVAQNSVLAYDENQKAWVSKSIYDVIDIMVGADQNNMGISGLVPAPGVGEQGYFLRGDGVWAQPNTNAGLKRKIFSSLDEAKEFAALEAHPEEYMFLVRVEDSEDNAYEEYIWVEGNLEKIGSHAVDLSGYATLQQLETKVDKQEGYSLISIADLQKLSTIENKAEVNFINSIDEIEFNVFNRHLSLNTIDVNKIKNLSSADPIVALNKRVTNNTITIAEVERSVGNVVADLNNYVKKSAYEAHLAEYRAEMERINQSITWHDV